MPLRTSETSPQLYARIGGAIYLAIIVLGMFGEAGVRDRLTVSGDPAATAANILASPLLWRFGIAGDIVVHILDVPLDLIFFVLLRPVHRNLALLAIMFGLISTAVEVLNKLNLLATLILLGDASYLHSFEPAQLQTLAYLAIKLHGYGFGLSLVFFGCECVVLGYLIARSGFLPRTIGMLMGLAGLCYLVNSFALLLAPGLADLLFPWILLPSFVGESSVCLWLLLKGVNVTSWQKRALQ